MWGEIQDCAKVILPALQALPERQKIIDSGFRFSFLKEEESGVLIARGQGAGQAEIISLSTADLRAGYVDEIRVKKGPTRWALRADEIDYLFPLGEKVFPAAEMRWKAAGSAGELRFLSLEISPEAFIHYYPPAAGSFKKGNWKDFRGLPDSLEGTWGILGFPITYSLDFEVQAREIFERSGLKELKAVLKS